MKFLLSAVNAPFREPVSTPKTPVTDPEIIIKRWCRYSKKYPTCVAICPETKQDGLALLNWAKEHFDVVEKYMLQYNCPYKVSWIRDTIDLYVAKNETSMQWDYDQLSPFSFG